MKKRILSLLLVLVMVVSLVPTAALAYSTTDVKYAVTGGNIYFNKRTGEITDCDESVTEAVIPSKIAGISVTSIGNSAFENCTNLKSITIPDGVTDIGDSAFAVCTSLTSIAIPYGVKTIGNFTFASCANLTSVSIPNSVTEIYDYAFSGCASLTSIMLPDSVTSIIGSAFSGCDSLTSVTIPNGVTEIGYGAFEYCKSLTRINVADANTAYCSVDGVLFNKNKTELVQYPAGKSETSYTIPNGVTVVGCRAFSGCKNLTSIIIPDGVTSIDWYAFQYCTGLNNIAIPNGVTSLGWGVFRGCTSLTSITIPNGVTIIDEQLFSDCTGLTSVTIPNSVTIIGNSAFSDCSSLTDVYYSGSEAQWKKIDKYGYNDELFDARIHYNSVSPVTPTGISDVASGSYCYDAVQWAVEKGITNGTDSTHFSPNRGCTRAQVVTFLWRAAGEPSVSARVNFVDVSTSSVYYKAIKWAVANGITKGTDATHFSPDATCTRGQVVTFMHRAANEPYVIGMGGFVDVTYGSYCYDAVQWAVAEGITNGTDIAHFSPNATCTRGQVVTFLYRAQ